MFFKLEILGGGMGKLVRIVAGALLPTVLVASSGCMKEFSGFMRGGGSSSYVEEYPNMRSAPKEQKAEIRELAESKLEDTEVIGQYKVAYKLFMSVGDYEGAKRSIESLKEENPGEWVGFLNQLNMEREKYESAE